MFRARRRRSPKPPSLPIPGAASAVASQAAASSSRSTLAASRARTRAAIFGPVLDQILDKPLQIIDQLILISGNASASTSCKSIFRYNGLMNTCTVLSIHSNVAS